MGGKGSRRESVESACVLRAGGIAENGIKNEFLMLVKTQ